MKTLMIILYGIWKLTSVIGCVVGCGFALMLLIGLFNSTNIGWWLIGGVMIAIVCACIYLLGLKTYEDIEDRKVANRSKQKYEDERVFCEDLMHVLNRDGYSRVGVHIDKTDITVMDRVDVIYDEEIGAIFYTHRVIFKKSLLSEEAYEMTNYDMRVGKYGRNMLSVNLDEDWSPKKYAEDKLETMKNMYSQEVIKECRGKQREE